MTDTPIWPGVAEYLYHAASSARVLSDGTWIVPFGLTPRRSSFECTPIAGISTDTGSARRPGNDEKDAGHPGNTGTEACELAGRRSVTGLRPGHDPTKPGFVQRHAAH